MPSGFKGQDPLGNHFLANAVTGNNGDIKLCHPLYLLVYFNSFLVIVQLGSLIGATLGTVQSAISDHKFLLTMSRLDVLLDGMGHAFCLQGSDFNIPQILILKIRYFPDFSFTVGHEAGRQWLFEFG